MKKRAIFSTFASLALAGVMCVGFAACGGETAESVNGEEVTADQWASALENEDLYKNFKLNVNSDIVMEMKVSAGTETKEIKVSGTQTGEIVYADSKTYSKNTATVTISGLSDEEKALMNSMLESMLGDFKEGTTEEESYVDESAEPTKYIVKDEDGKWVYDDYGTGGLKVLSGLARMIGDYENYEYSEHFKGYVEKGTAEDAEEYTVVKFKDGKLKAIYEKSGGAGDSSGMSMTQTMTTSYVITYDGQSVTVPTVSE